MLYNVTRSQLYPVKDHEEVSGCEKKQKPIVTCCYCTYQHADTRVYICVKSNENLNLSVLSNYLVSNR